MAADRTNAKRRRNRAAERKKPVLGYTGERNCSSGTTTRKMERLASLVQRFAGGLFQSLDFVPDHQLTALQLDNMEVVRGKMHERFVQFTFQNPMFPFQFNEMRLYCHTKSPLFGSYPQIRPRQMSVHQPGRLSMNIENVAVIFAGLSEMIRDCRDPVAPGNHLAVAEIQGEQRRLAPLTGRDDIRSTSRNPSQSLRDSS
jgi:hypothetical protein